MSDFVCESAKERYNFGMDRYPKLKMSLLRDIGWNLWDPMGLGLPGEGWPQDCANEYDGYLLHVVSMLHRGKTSEEAISYLDWVGAEHMGLGLSTPEAKHACVATVDAIIAYLQTLPDGPLNVR